MPVSKNKLVLALIIILLLGNVFFGVQYYLSLQKFQEQKSALLSYQRNEKVLKFTQLFVEKVLKADNEVSFDDRLKIESAVRDINNKEILDQWQKFVDSKTENQAQEEVKNLMDVLINKIAY